MLAWPGSFVASADRSNFWQGRAGPGGRRQAVFAQRLLAQVPYADYQSRPANATRNGGAVQSACFISGNAHFALCPAAVKALYQGSRGGTSFATLARSWHCHCFPRVAPETHAHFISFPRARFPRTRRQG